MLLLTVVVAVQSMWQPDRPPLSRWIIPAVSLGCFWIIAGATVAVWATPPRPVTRVGPLDLSWLVLSHVRSVALLEATGGRQPSVELSFASYAYASGIPLGEFIIVRPRVDRGRSVEIGTWKGIAICISGDERWKLVRGIIESDWELRAVGTDPPHHEHLLKASYDDAGVRTAMRTALGAADAAPTSAGSAASSSSARVGAISFCERALERILAVADGLAADQARVVQLVVLEECHYHGVSLGDCIHLRGGDPGGTGAEIGTWQGIRIVCDGYRQWPLVEGVQVIDVDLSELAWPSKPSRWSLLKPRHALARMDALLRARREARSALPSGPEAGPASA